MVDTDTLLTPLYVMIDEVCQAYLPPEVPPGPQAALSRSAGIPRGLFGPWACCPSERVCYRDAQCHLRAAFPTLPHRTQFNHLLHRHDHALVACVWPFVARLLGRHGGRTSAGAIAAAGTKASTCSSP